MKYALAYTVISMVLASCSAAATADDKSCVERANDGFEKCLKQGEERCTEKRLLELDTKCDGRPLHP